MASEEALKMTCIHLSYATVTTNSSHKQNAFLFFFNKMYILPNCDFTLLHEDKET